MALSLEDIDPVLLARMTPEERLEFEALTEGLVGHEGLDQFITRNWPNEPPPSHLQIVTRTLERARTERLRVCISMPPRHGKSITIRRAIAWWLKQRPADYCGYTTYNDHTAWEMSAKCRKDAVNAGIQLGAIRKAQRWETDEGGGLVACGRNGALTGKGIHGLLVVDDPFKNRLEADSDTVREQCWEWFNEVVMTRLEGGSVIVIHTRWHEDDLIGRLEAEGGWEIINIPAVCENADDILGRAIGDALWESRGGDFTAESLRSTKQRIGDFSFYALYQGQPRPRGSKLFGRPPSYYDVKTVNFEGCTGSIGADPAATADTRADNSAAVAIAIRGPLWMPTVYIREVYRKQTTVPQFARDLREFQKRNWGAPANVEAVGAFAVVPQLLQEMGQAEGTTVLVNPITGSDLGGDKFQRAQLIAAAWNDGRVLLPNDSPPWLADFVNELMKFTGVKDPEDDQVDALSHAFNPVCRAEIVKRGARAAPDRWS